MSNFINLALILVFFLPSSIFCNFTVYSPEILSNEFIHRSIKYSLANFGHIPYGRNLIGELKLSDPLDACSPINVADGEKQESPFLLISRGNCTFVTKAKYAQLSGAKVAVIVDNRDEETDQITMMDDGFSYSVKIPAIFISRNDGDILKNYLESVDTNKNSITMTLSFEVEKESNVNYSFWISTINRNSFRLIRDFKPFYQKLSSHAAFSPHYSLFSCYPCSLSNFTNLPPDTCISGGRYCAADPDGRGPATGAQVVEEDLRQLCIHKTSPDLWWEYLMKFDENCIDIQVVEECSRELMERVGIPKSKIDECVEKSFRGNETDKKRKINKNLDENYLLRNEVENAYKLGIQFWPSVTINDHAFKGYLNADSIFEAVCSKFASENRPEACKELFGIQTVEGGVNTGTVVIVILCCLVVFFLFLFLVYRRWVKTQVNEEMSGRVNDMVNQYIAFYENREKNKLKVELV